MMNLTPKRAIVLYEPDLSSLENEPRDLSDVILIHDLNENGDIIGSEQPSMEGIKAFFSWYFNIANKSPNSIYTIEGGTNTIHYWKIVDTKLFLCWLIPQKVRTISFRNEKLDILFPNMVFMYGKKELYAYGYKKFKGNNTSLYRLQLPHFYADSHVCLGTTAESITKILSNESNIDMIAIKIESAIFTSQWTHQFSSIFLKKNQLGIQKNEYLLPMNPLKMKLHEAIKKASS